MQIKKNFRGIIAAAVSISLFLAGTLQAGPTGGEFTSSSDVALWHPQGYVIYNGGEQNVTLDEYSGSGNISSLWQKFSIGTQDKYLYFDMLFNSEVEPRCDEFTASLNDTVFYFLDNTGAPAVYDSTKVSVQGPVDGWHRVFLDVGLFAGENVTLSFELFGELAGMHTTIKLDNIGVSEFIAGVEVPAPGAMLLAAIGAGFAGWLRKSGKLR